MAFNRDTLNPISNAVTGTGTPALYSYGSVDPVATVTADGYFNSLSSELNPGDIIICSLGALDAREVSTVVVREVTQPTTTATGSVTVAASAG